LESEDLTKIRGDKKYPLNRCQSKGLVEQGELDALKRAKVKTADCLGVVSGPGATRWQRMLDEPSHLTQCVT
jgi:hypothetical protein